MKDMWTEFGLDTRQRAGGKKHMNIITTLLALCIVMIPLLFLLVLASMVSIGFGLTGILYYLPHLFVFVSCVYYLTRNDGG